jgi:hypothetical protein
MWRLCFAISTGIAVVLYIMQYELEKHLDTCLMNCSALNGQGKEKPVVEYR